MPVSLYQLHLHALLILLKLMDANNRHQQIVQLTQVNI